jgi:hypothetical protein
MSSILEFHAYGSFGRAVHVDVSRVTHWERIDPNGREGVKVHFDTGASVSLDNDHGDVPRRLIRAKDERLRAAYVTPIKTVDAIVAKAAAAVVRQLSLPESHEALDRDLVMAVCTYVMEQASE